MVAKPNATAHTNALAAVTAITTATKSPSPVIASNTAPIHLIVSIGNTQVNRLVVLTVVASAP